jgi:hypothetical protein
MLQSTNNIERLDEHMLEVARAVHGAVKQRVSHANEPKVMDDAIRDCKEILDEIMTGNVPEWLN